MIAIALAATLTVFAASSLREAFITLAQAFQKQHPGTEVAFNFAGSQDLRLQIEHGAQADVFASADLKQMQALQKQGFARDPQIFARNEPVLVTPLANPAGLRAFVDLPRARRIVLGTPEVPIGEYSEQILTAAGTAFRNAVLKHVVSRELNVRQVLAKVTLGEADAAIVYRTDAATAKDRLQIIDIPAAPLAEYPIAAVSTAPLADQFVALVRSAEGSEILKTFGFR